MAGAPEAQGPWGKLGTLEFYDIGTIVAGKSGGKVFRDPLYSHRLPLLGVSETSDCLIKVIGRGSYAKVGLCYFRSFCSFFSFSSFCFLLIAPCSLPIAPRSGVDGGAEVHEEDFRHEGDQEGADDG